MKATRRWGLWFGVVPFLAGCAIDPGDPEQTRQVSLSLAAQDEEQECVVSDHDTEHACQHAEFGPFASVAAQPYPGLITSNISTPHTAYTVTLPSEGTGYLGGTYYFPAATGQYAFFLNPETTLALYDSNEQLVEPEAQGSVDPEVCAVLSEAAIYDLNQSDFYTVVFGPATDPSVLTIVEYLGEHRECDSCEEVHLTAAKTAWPPSRDDGSVTLDHPITFEIPDVVPVTVGEASGGLVSLKFSSGGGPAMKCWYWGSFSSPHEFEFLHCNGGLAPGDDAEADEFRLRIEFGGVTGGVQTAVELEIEDEACHEHDDDHGDDHEEEE